jgi:uncharacterized membrane protein
LAYAALLPFYLKIHLTPEVGLMIGLAPLIFAVVAVAALLKLAPSGRWGPMSIDAPPVGDRTPDRYWRLGMFYVNPDDPAIFVEKRFGIGYTLNFAHLASWLIVLVLIALLALIPFATNTAS